MMALVTAMLGNILVLVGKPEACSLIGSGYSTANTLWVLIGLFGANLISSIDPCVVYLQ